ncbi:alpha/beta hydrolase [Gymnodinialimonas sp. 2305UL16-5]|uniref:alpha/beta fold hydrolase n=1 Tax=Gymnodinialimonas mytili TaxID=3126503 RepID=UPI0030A2EAAB
MLNGTWIGPKDAPMVLLLHGGGMDARSMAPLADRLPHYRCFLPDLPGHQASRHVPFQGLPAAADAVVATARAKTDAPVHLFGLSLGGFVTLHILARHPEFAASAIVSGIHPGTMPFKGLTGLMLRTIYPMMHLRRLREASARAAGIDDVSLMNNLDGGPLADAKTIRDVGLAALGFDLADLATTISTRTLVLAGDEEVSAVRRGLGKFGAALTQSQSASIPGGGHGWCLSDPDLAAEVIVAWISGTDLPAQLAPLGSNPPDAQAIVQ